MTQVFISYSRRDKDFARQLVDALAERQRDSWADWKDIPLTAEWHQEILANIDAADYFVFVISPDSTASVVCRQEIEHAEANNKRMIPVFYRTVPDQAVPPALAKFQRIDFRDGDQFDSQFAMLIQALETDLPWIQAHTRLLTRAKEWERAARDRSFLLRGTDLRDAERWMTKSGSGEPRPTLLHSQYIVLSRQAVTKQQRIIFASVAIACVVAGGLAVFAFMTERLKQDALARSLAGKSAAIMAKGGDTNLATLLALESVKRSATDDGAQALRDAIVYLRKVRTFSAGSKDISQLAFSPDSKRLVAIARSDDPLARVFSVDTGKELLSLRNDGDVAQAVFSADGRWLLTGSADKTARVWDAASGAQLQRFESDSEVAAVAFGPHGLIAAGNKTAAVLWDLQTGRELVRLDHAAAVRVVAFSPGDRWFASGAIDGSVQLWDRLDGSRKTLPRQEKAIRSLAFSPTADSQLLIASADDDSRGKLVIVDVTTGGELAQASFLENNPPARVVYSADHDKILMHGPGFASAWDAGLKPLFEQHAQAVLDRALLSGDGRLFITGGRDALRIFDVRQMLPGKELARIPLTDRIRAAELSADGRWLATVAEGTVRIIEVHSPLESLRWPLLGPVSNVAFSANGRWAVVASEHVWLADLQRPWDPPRDFSAEPAETIAMNPDGTRLVTGTQTRLTVWDTPTGQVLGSASLPGGRVPAPLAFSADASRVLMGLSYARIKAFDWAKGQWSDEGAIDLVHGIGAGANLLAVRPDDHSIRILEADSQRQTSVLSFDFAPFELGFGGNDKLLVGIDQREGLAQVWDLDSKKSLAKVSDFEGVRAAAVSADGRLVATVGRDSSVRFQLWRNEELTKYACALVTRPISAEEWSRYLPEVTYAGARTCAVFGSAATR